MFHRQMFFVPRKNANISQITMPLRQEHAGSAPSAHTARERGTPRNIRASPSPARYLQAGYFALSTT